MKISLNFIKTAIALGSNAASASSFAITAVVVIAVLFLLACGRQKTKEFRIEDLGFRPNILWITCEDITPAFGCYGGLRDKVIRINGIFIPDRLNYPNLL